MTGLDELFRLHAEEAVRLAYVLTGDRQIAEDLAQDAFIRVSRRLVHLRNPDAFGSYLRQTVVNLSNSYFRRRRIERDFLRREQAFARRPDERQPPETAVIIRETLRAQLLRLPIRQRTAIVLRFSEDLSDTQIAEIMHTSPGGARQLIYRGMTTLREHTPREHTPREHTEEERHGN